MLEPLQVLFVEEGVFDLCHIFLEVDLTFCQVAEIWEEVDESGERFAALFVVFLMRGLLNSLADSIPW